MDSPSPEPFSTADEVAAALSLNRDTVIYWARTGKIPRHCLTRKVIRFRLTEVIAALEESQ